MIPFNKPYLTGFETQYIEDAVRSGKISGNGKYTQRCQEFFQQRYGFRKCLLTTSCTDALEMAAILFDIQPGDEVIMPAYTFVSTANAFVLRGAHIVFVDSMPDHPNMDVSQIESLITPRTKAIVPVHYAGMACDMDTIMELAAKYGLLVVEDAAQAIDSYYIGKDGKERPLGSIGHLAAFSFHETKNIISGEGGMLVINDSRFEKRAEIIWEKGTNRAAFWRGEIIKYGWVDVGSSFLPSEIIAAFLWAQLENLEDIQAVRLNLWHQYYEGLMSLEEKGFVSRPILPQGATNNAHLFYLIFENENRRNHFMHILRSNDVHAVFHYLSLHSSEFFKSFYKGNPLQNAERLDGTLLRLPLFYELQTQGVEKICKILNEAS